MSQNLDQRGLSRRYGSSEKGTVLKKKEEMEQVKMIFFEKMLIGKTAEDKSDYKSSTLPSPFFLFFLAAVGSQNFSVT